MSTTPTSNNIPKIDAKEKKFIDAVKEMPDPRDNRGKRHNLGFLIISVIFAMLSNRSKTSSIHRFITNKINLLREITGIYDAKPISRAHLPRLLAQLDWEVLNLIIYECYDSNIIHSLKDEWLAGDGKALRGSQSGEKQSVIHLVTHQSRIDVAQARMQGEKSSEITVMREFLKKTGLQKCKITLDAHHCNPESTAQIAESQGRYITQVKENQPILLTQCKELAEKTALMMTEDTTVDSSNGRVTERQARIFPMATVPLDSRWQKCGIKTLIVMRRETFDKKKKKTTNETSYYISNEQVDNSVKGKELSTAVRTHWGVESNNWILDAIFDEDNVKVKNGNQAQIMAKLRCFAANVVRWSGAKNTKEKLEEFVDLPSSLVSTLTQLNFL